MPRAFYNPRQTHPFNPGHGNLGFPWIRGPTPGKGGSFTTSSETQLTVMNVWVTIPTLTKRSSCSFTALKSGVFWTEFWDVWLGGWEWRTWVFFGDSKMPYCWCFRNPAITSWYGKYPIIYKVLYIPGGAGFLPSTVWTDFKYRGKLYQIITTHDGSMGRLYVYVPTVTIQINHSCW